MQLHILLSIVAMMVLLGYGLIVGFISSLILRVRAIITNRK